MRTVHQRRIAWITLLLAPRVAERLVGKLCEVIWYESRPALGIFFSVVYNKAYAA